MAIEMKTSWKLATWKALAHTWNGKIEECRPFMHIDTVMDCQRAFRKEFEELCGVEEMADVDLLFSTLELGAVDHFVESIDRGQHLVAPKSLTAIVYRASFMSLVGQCERRREISEMTELIGLLNKQMPDLPEDALSSSDDHSMQDTLRRVFHSYMEHLFKIVESFNPATPTSNQSSGHDFVIKSQSLTNDVRSLGPKLNRLLPLNLNRRNVSLPESASRAFQKSIDGFIPGRQLGQGSFGRVIEVRDEKSGAVYAKKTTLLRAYGGSTVVEDKERVEKEFMTMEKLAHTHIVRVWRLRFESDEFSFIMWPVADMNLDEYLSKSIKDHYPGAALSNIRGWYGCLLQALAYLHRAKIQHNDVKPQNILVKDDKGSVKVYFTDFGLAKNLGQGAESSAGDIIRGTPNYRAPESRHGTMPSYPSDVYALGCVFAEMTSVLCRKSLDEFRVHRRTSGAGDHPYAFRHEPKLIKSWLDGLDPEPLSAVMDLVYLVRKMMNPEPQDRWTAKRAVTQLKSNENGWEVFCEECLDAG